MTYETIVAVYETNAHADAAVRDLKADHISADAISQQAGTTGTGTTEAHPREQGFWANLFGGEPDQDTAVYDRSVDAGSSVVTVKVPEADVGRVTEILESHHPIDIDERAASFGLTRTTTTTRTPMAAPMPPRTAPMGTTPVTDGDTMHLAEERITIGKRVINRGGTRVRRFVVETPVEEQVTLHDETVTLERNAVTDGRPVEDAAFSERTIEMTESREEAVIAKTAHITEEVRLRKEATDRVETVRDSVRREDVKIEQIPGDQPAAAAAPVTPPMPRPAKL